MPVLRTGDYATEWASGQNKYRSYNWTGYCLKFVRMCFNVGSLYPSAEYAWYRTKKRHSSWPPPKGVPVWWTNGRYGHVALSDGHGYCWSTDFLRTGHVDRVPIKSITAGWGQTYRGWTEDINGVDVYDPPKVPVLDASYIAHTARTSGKAPNSKLLKREVAREVGRGFMILRSPVLGRGFRRQYKKVQRRYLRSIGVDPTPKMADGIPGIGSLTWLGKRRGFKVRP